MARHGHRTHAADTDDLAGIDLGVDPAAASVASQYRFLNDVPEGPDNDAAPAGRRFGTRRARAWLAAGTAVVVTAAATTAILTRPGPSRRDISLRVPKAVTATTTNPAGAVPPKLDASVRALWPVPFMLGGAAGILSVDPQRGTITRAVTTHSPTPEVSNRNGEVVVVTDGRQQLLVDTTGAKPTLSRRGETFIAGLVRGQFWATGAGKVTAIYGTMGTFRLPHDYEALAQAAGFDPSTPPAESGYLLHNTALQTLAFWRPDSPDSPRALPGHRQKIVAVRSDRVAWIGTDCGELRCALHVTDVRSGLDVTIGFPFPTIANGQPASLDTLGRFSPDGRYVAALVPDPAAPSGRLTLFDLQTGTARSVLELSTAPAVGPGSSTGLPFDWSPNSKALVALNRDTSGHTRLDRIEASSGLVRVSRGTVPPSSSLVTIGTPPSNRAAPWLHRTRPLLGEQTGLVLAQLENSNTLERLDLDTGGVDRLLLGQPDVVPQTSDAAGAPSLLPLRGGALLVHGFDAWWVPPQGRLRRIATAVAMVPENSDRAWLVEPANGSTFSLVPVDGTTGATGTPVKTFVRPEAAVSKGFVEVLPPTIDHPTTIDVVDPHTHARVGIGAHTTTNLALLAAAGDVVVWSGDCTTTNDPSLCGVRITNVVSGVTQHHDNWAARELKLAPDGHAVLYVPTAGEGAGVPGLFDFTTGRSTPLPGGNGIGGFAWGRNGWVFYATDGSLGAWRPGLTGPRLVAGATLLLENAVGF
ncbi:MAG: hypothetical protein JWL83_2995 [Actinomycetia bacterium]|nr:hypothetical protein [Actinomycetes bacterium]